MFVIRYTSYGTARIWAALVHNNNVPNSFWIAMVFQVTPDRGGVHHAKKRLPMNDHGNDMSPQLSDDPIVSRPSYGRPFTANGSNSQKKGPRRHAGLGSKPLKARNGGCGFSYRESKKLSSKKVSVSYSDHSGGGGN